MLFYFFACVRLNKCMQTCIHSNDYIYNNTVDIES